MHAASRESYAAVAERLDAYARGAEPSAIITTADDLISVAELLRREQRVRRAGSGSARDGTGRAGLFTSVLGTKVGADANELLNQLVSGRWSAPSELLEAAERLGVEALLAGAERAGELGEIEDELFRFGQIVSGDPQL